MRILLACQQSPHRYAIPAYAFWRTYFVAGLREAGHEVVEVPDADWARGLVALPSGEHARWLDETWSLTLATLRTSPPVDLFLGYLYPPQISPAAVREIRRHGVPAVNFFCDNVREYRRLPGEFAPFDLHWVPEFDALPLYAARGWRTVFAPMPCWVPPASRQLPTTEKDQVTFVGRRDELRAQLFADAARRGLPISIHGSGWTAPTEAPAPSVPPTWRARWRDWSDYYRRQGAGPTWRRLSRRTASLPVTFDFGPHVHASPADDRYADLLARSAVTIGVNRYAPPLHPGQPPPTYSRLRDLEAPMLGACYLTEWAPELPQLYALGSEIETFSDAAELTEKSAALLADPARRRALRLAGQRRALADHTVGASLARIARTLGLPVSPST